MRLRGIRGMMGIGAIACLAALGVIGVACGDNGNATMASSAEAVDAQRAAQAGQSGPAGIWVTGTGSMQLAPDLALLNVGVETFGETVADARQQAATAMDSILGTLSGTGVADRDIQTRYFNISPQYEYHEVEVSGRRQSKQVLVGYRVNNSVTVKLRDLDAVGETIDGVAEAGGDTVRIDGIRFTVEDTDRLIDDLREMAVADAQAKAKHLADLAGVSIGRLVYVTEGGGAPVAQDFFGSPERVVMKAMALESGSPVSGGELELSLSVQAGFSIE